MRKTKSIFIVIGISAASIVSVVAIMIFLPPPPQMDMGRYVLCVREASDYGENNFTDNGDGTITDLATGLMWMKDDSGTTMNWSASLNYTETLSFAGHDDWRLTNAKELHSIVDYTHAPDATDSAKQGPAINTTVFNLTDDDSWFWTGTTHLEGGGSGIYICFGIASAYNSSAGDFSMNAHGAGAQRSDPKSGDPGDYPKGNGPQGDQIRIYNYARAVRNATDADNYVIVDTGQMEFYGIGNNIISEPSEYEIYHGQDAQYNGFQSAQHNNGDNTITDLITGLMWQKAPASEKYDWDDAVSYAENLNFASHDDWRLPTVKELYSLIDFNGNINTLTPYIDTDYFDFQYPDTSTGARIIDVQYWTCTRYLGKVMYGQEGAFGVNFADGRIKCYPLEGL